MHAFIILRQFNIIFNIIIMLTKDIISCMLAQSLSSPLQLIEQRAQLLRAHGYESGLLESADKIQINQGILALWKGLPIQIARYLFLLNIQKFLSKRQRRIMKKGISTFLLSLSKIVVSSSLYYAALIARIDTSRDHRALIDIYKAAMKIPNYQNTLSGLALISVSSFASNQLSKMWGKLAKKRASGRIYRISKNLLRYVIAIGVLYPLLTIGNRMIVNDISFQQAVHDNKFYAGFEACICKKMVEYLVNDLFFTTR